MEATRTLSRVATAAMIALSLMASPAQAERQSWLAPWEAVKCPARHGVSACVNAKDAADWARGVTRWKFGESAHNNKGDAFRHCIWAGAMAQRMGVNRAWAISWDHEQLDSSQPKAERAMDEQNNYIGVQVGERSNRHGGSDTWGWVMNECERLANSRQLYGPNRQRGAY